MRTTEEEAAGRWCPMVRLAALSTSAGGRIVTNRCGAHHLPDHPAGGVRFTITRDVAGNEVRRDDPPADLSPGMSRCIGTGCMAWRERRAPWWVRVFRTAPSAAGYCGAFDRPA